ncbi:uncharacterized protein LOC106661008 [Cimex lectularius]|uniref:Peptidase aspartic putative domain-containing protein n=1 Tax=Cimex lectularius TaxID=79782 RepID=A0A8I6R981_CIMLE|nr:uncharacterized protein LOC106661008 [Cimex lectularius]
MSLGYHYLADESFHIPGPVDGIIGSELFPHLVSGTKIMDGPDAPVAVHTRLGFVVMGKAPLVGKSREQKHTLLSKLSSPEIQVLERFWEIEIPTPVRPMITKQDAECERHFLNTVQRTEGDRFSVALLFREDPEILGDSSELACKRFLNLEARLARSPDLKKVYHDVFYDHLQQGHMSPVQGEHDRTGYFIPHHAVFKPQSTSTPVRVVFDASAKTSSGKSLNDVLFVGPKLQANLVSLLMNFRIFAYALTADVRQMYRQILVTERHRRYQRILWRFDREHPLSMFELNTVVFGISSSPYLALPNIQQLVDEEGKHFSLAAEVTARDMYMDDLLTSVSSLQEAKILYRQSKDLFCRGF